MKRRMVILAAVLALACGPGEPELATDTLLWRVDQWSETGPSVRVATATILTFRSSGEFVELHCRVIERADSTVYIVSDAPRIVMVGTWTREGSDITVTRTRVKRPSPFRGPRDPFCDTTLRFRVSGQSVTGQAGEATTGTYSPVTRLVMPEFESYATDARERGAACVAAAP
jgi:hypothetical protein